MSAGTTKRVRSRGAMALLAALVLPSAPLAAVDWSQPSVEPQDTLGALAASDEYAWRLFVALSWPANVAERKADSSKKLGADGPVVWETWQNARDVFLKDGVDPGPWKTGAPTLQATPARFDALPLQQQIRFMQANPNKALPMFDPVAASTQANETRLNKEAFTFVRDNDLYNLDGQLKLLNSGAEVSFPVAAKEIKAQWRPITEAQRSRYHTVEVKAMDGTKQLFGLTSLHITTKDLPNWLWATFEHVDNPTLPGNEKWLLKSRDTFACKLLPSDCNRAPSGIGLEGTKWENYRLRGTQIDFIDSRGRPTLLANSQPEEGFQNTASCITCHARASIGMVGGKPARLEIFDNRLSATAVRLDNAPSYYGPPNEEWFYSDAQAIGRQRLYLQLDFVWSLFRAKPKAHP